MRKERAMKEQQLCKDFLRLNKGTIVDPIQAARMMDRRWGIKVDWHEMAYALDWLRSSQEATITGYTNSGFTQYIIE